MLKKGLRSALPSAVIRESALLRRTRFHLLNNRPCGYLPIFPYKPYYLGLILPEFRALRYCRLLSRLTIKTRTQGEQSDHIVML
jgi:hypothetical protein